MCSLNGKLLILKVEWLRAFLNEILLDHFAHVTKEAVSLTCFEINKCAFLND